MVEPQVTATNIDEFNEQARNFMVRAKEAGKSNTAIANTIKFMYGLYAQKQAEQPTYQYQQDEYGNYAFDPKTGELINITPSFAGDDILADFEATQAGTVDTAQGTPGQPERTGYMSDEEYAEALAEFNKQKQPTAEATPQATDPLSRVQSFLDENAEKMRQSDLPLFLKPFAMFGDKPKTGS